MASADAPHIAVFVDLENVAIGVLAARYNPFDIDLFLTRPLQSG